MVICIQWLSKNASISYVREKAIKWQNNDTFPDSVCEPLRYYHSWNCIWFVSFRIEGEGWLEIMKRTVSILRSPFYFILSVQGTDSNGSPQWGSYCSSSGPSTLDGPDWRVEGRDPLLRPPMMFLHMSAQSLFFTVAFRAKHAAKGTVCLIGVLVHDVCR